MTGQDTEFGEKRNYTNTQTNIHLLQYMQQLRIIFYQFFTKILHHSTSLETSLIRKIDAVIEVCVTILGHQNYLRTIHTTAKHSVMNSAVCCHPTAVLPFQQDKNASILIPPATEVVTGSVA